MGLVFFWTSKLYVFCVNKYSIFIQLVYKEPFNMWEKLFLFE